jgi:hypothetical protein
MKKILILITFIALFIGACCPNASAQTSTPSDPVSYMTPTQRAKYEADLKLAELQTQKDMEIAKLENKIKQYGDWVGVGGEVGQAIEEGLSAVVGVADQFGKTDVGKFTMVLIAWKVMGHDIVRILLGIAFFAVLVTLLRRFYRNTIADHKVLTKRTPQGFWKRNINEYEIVESKLDGDEQAWLTVGLVAAFLLGIWITCGIMF